MKTLQIAFSALIIFAAFGCNNSNNSSKDEQNQDSMVATTDTTLNKNENASELDSNDVHFFKEAAIGGMTEVESSAKIIQLGSSKDVLAFANMMVKDHSEAGKKLAELARSKGYDVPANLPAEKVELIKKLGNYKEDGRKEAYVNMMVTDHIAAIDLFTKAKSSTDKDIAAFAGETLPTLNHHYGEIKKIQKNVIGEKANQGDDPLKLSDKKHGQ